MHHRNVSALLPSRHAVRRCGWVVYQLYKRKPSLPVLFNVTIALFLFQKMFLPEVPIWSQFHGLSVVVVQNACALVQSTGTSTRGYTRRRQSGMSRSSCSC